MNYRTFFRTLAAVAVFAASLFVALPQASPAGSEALKIVTGPYLQAATENSVTIVWITNRNSTGAVELGPSGAELKTVANSRDGLIDANERVHKVALTDLKPGAVYRYRAVSRDILKFGSNKVDYGETVTSDLLEFRTFDRSKQEYSFLVFNDIHDISATIADLLKMNGDRPYDFVVLNGDTVSSLDGESRITPILDQAVASFASRIPLFWLRGNHETRGSFARQFPGYIASPTGRYYYSFSHGPVRFVVLDTGEDKTDSHVEYSGLADFERYRREEAEWLRAEVKTPAFRQARFRVVFAHMPFPAAPRPQAPGTPPSPFTGMEDGFRNFGATLDGAGVDMMISGHVHSPAIIQPEPGRHKYPIVRGGGPKDQGRTLIRVEVKGRTLDATILRPDGTVFGTSQVSSNR
ncbi:MAG: metallophosphoesterase family protein [Bryobacterales bacterium]|nr:metallophosphoesterase family protein [Bryobacterales bacterium]